MSTWKRETVRLGALVLFVLAVVAALFAIGERWGDATRILATQTALTALIGFLWDWPRRPPEERARKLLAGAVRLHPRTVAEFGAASVAVAGFTMHKDGVEYGVFVDGERIKPAASPPAPEAMGYGLLSPAPNAGARDEMNPLSQADVER